MMTLFNEKIIARCMVGATLLCMPMSHNEIKAIATKWTWSGGFEILHIYTILFMC